MGTRGDAGTNTPQHPDTNIVGEKRNQKYAGKLGKKDYPLNLLREKLWGQKAGPTQLKDWRREAG